jgi:methylenetetrahydrofolate dehydrogenase (NADP+) / methenyltetrahydrofolate cyclohydrolase
MVKGMAVKTKIIEGRSMADDILSDIGRHIAERELPPKLAIVLVGKDPASKIFIEQKLKACKRIGAKSELRELSENATEKDLFALIERLNDDKSVDGILVQLPLPKHIDEASVFSSIDPTKDVDGLAVMNIGSALHGDETLIPATVQAVIAMIGMAGIELGGKEVVIVNRSSLVGKPLAISMLKRSATVTVCHTKTMDISVHTKMADIIVSATGQAGIIKGCMVKEGSTLIDVGCYKTPDGMVGDFDVESVSGKAANLTKVPGGIGPLTVAFTMKNLLYCANLQEEEE